MSEESVTISFNDALYLLVDAVNEHVFSGITVNIWDKRDIIIFLKFISILVEGEEKIKYISNLVNAMLEVMKK